MVIGLTKVASALMSSDEDVVIWLIKLMLAAVKVV